MPCEACAALRFDRAMAEAPGRSRPPRSGDDEPDDGEPDPSPTATDPADNHPGCSATTGARSPQPYFDRLTAAVERLNAARSLSRQLHALAGEAPIITNEQLALADWLRALP